MPDMTDTPAGRIARLDASLLKHGQPIVVWRRIGTSTTSFATRDARARLSGYTGTEVQGAVQVQDSKFITSPSTFDALPGWKDAAGATRSRYPERGDFIISQGRQRHIEQVEHVMVGDVVVRIEGRVR